jgi:hypothetical protein
MERRIARMKHLFIEKGEAGKNAEWSDSLRSDFRGEFLRN